MNGSSSTLLIVMPCQRFPGTNSSIMSLMLIPAWFVGVPPGLVDVGVAVETDGVMESSPLDEDVAATSAVSEAPPGDSFDCDELLMTSSPSSDGAIEVAVVDGVVAMALVDGQLLVAVLVLPSVDHVLSENGRPDDAAAEAGVSSLFCRFGAECAALSGFDPGALLTSAAEEAGVAADSLSGDGSFHCVRRDVPVCGWTGGCCCCGGGPCDCCCCNCGK